MRKRVTATESIASLPLPVSDEPKRRVRARLTVADDSVLEIICDRPLQRADWIVLYRVAIARSLMPLPEPKKEEP